MWTYLRSGSRSDPGCVSLLGSQLAWQSVAGCVHWLARLLAAVWSLAAVAMMVLSLAPPVVRAPAGCLQHPPCTHPLRCLSSRPHTLKAIKTFKFTACSATWCAGGRVPEHRRPARLVQSQAAGAGAAGAAGGAAPAPARRGGGRRARGPHSRTAPQGGKRREGSWGCAGYAGRDSWGQACRVDLRLTG